MIMGKKNGTPKSRWMNENTKCSCFYCVNGGVEKYLKNKYRWYKEAITSAINDL